MLLKVISSILLLGIVLSAGKYWYTPNEITGGENLIILGLLEMVPSGNVGTASVTFPLSYNTTTNYVILGNQGIILGGNTFGIASADTNFQF